MLAKLMEVLNVGKDDASNILVNTAKAQGAALFVAGAAANPVGDLGAAATAVALSNLQPGPTQVNVKGPSQDQAVAFKR